MLQVRQKVAMRRRMAVMPQRLGTPTTLAMLRLTTPGQSLRLSKTLRSLSLRTSVIGTASERSGHMHKNGWLYLTTGTIVMSVLSLLIPVLTYVDPSGVRQGYNIFGLLGLAPVPPLSVFVFAHYEGTFLRGVAFETISTLAVVLCVIGVAAIVMALVGVWSMSKQYESETPYHLARFGIVGTAIPSLTLLVLFLLSFSSFPGTMTLGPYVLWTPLAMLFAWRTVTARHRLTQEEAAAKAAAEAYIRPAGDLPIVSRKGNQYYG